MKPLLAFFGAMLLVACGGGGHYPRRAHPQPGDLHLTWSFLGLTCDEMGDIRNVRVSIPGEVLANGGFYPCQMNGVSGVILRDFAPGDYVVTVEGKSYNGLTTFEATTTIYVDGDTDLAIDLAPIYGPDTYAYLSWALPTHNGKPLRCADIGARYVLVSIDQGDFQTFACEAGLAGVRSPLLWDGPHTIELWAVTDSDYPLLYGAGAFDTYPRAATSATFSLHWAVGGVTVAWQLKDNGVVKSCAQLGVQSVSINFIDSYGYAVYGPGGDLQPCNASSVTYSYLTPGKYQVRIRAVGAGGAVYETKFQPTTHVKAGIFASQPLTVELVR